MDGRICRQTKTSIKGFAEIATKRQFRYFTIHFRKIITLLYEYIEQSGVQKGLTNSSSQSFQVVGGKVFKTVNCGLTENCFMVLQIKILSGLTILINMST